MKLKTQKYIISKEFEVSSNFVAVLLKTSIFFDYSDLIKHFSNHIYDFFWANKSEFTCTKIM